MGPLVPGQSRAGWKTPVVWKNTGRVQKPGKHPPDSGWTRDFENQIAVRLATA
jgi:hypothetical protein